MASKYWIKLYHEILDDPKMGHLPGEIFKHCIYLFLLASEYGKDGLLPEPKDIAWRLRIAPAELDTTLAELEHAGILTQTDSGWLVTNYQKRQSPSEAKERVKQYRDRKRKERQESNADVTIYNEESYGNVTESNACNAPDSETESESLPNGNGDKSPPTFEPEAQEPKTQDGQDEPVVTKSELEPANEQEALLFELLKPEFKAKGHRPPKKFPSLACKRKYVARAKYLGDNTGPAIERALQKGIASVTGIVDFIAKWNPENENKARNNGHETSRYKTPTIDEAAYRHLEAQNAVNTGTASRAGPPASRDRPAE